MASGNPAKAADDAVVKQVRAGIRAGKYPKIPLSPTTSIVINSTNEDEAEFITRVVLANVNSQEEDEFTSFLHAIELYSTLHALDAGRRKRLLTQLKKMLNAIGGMK